MGGTAPAEYLRVAQVEGSPKMAEENFAHLNHDDYWDVVREPHEFTVYQHENSFFIPIDESIKPTVVYRCGRLGMFAAQETLCGFRFYDITPEEMETLIYPEHPNWLSMAVNDGMAKSD